MNIALLGHGTVGRGVDQICAGLTGVDVTRILELPQFCTDSRMTSDIDDILSDSTIELVLECMGGLEPAHSYIAAALSAHKSVVTSNKAVVAAHFSEFAELADAHNACLFIEATCGGGIPWIASIEKVRRIDSISKISGIMNGTTNFIVDAMVRENADFAETLARAQELGYAEADPSADIDGIDVANKTRIACSVAFDVACAANIPVMGIRTLTKADLDLLANHGRTIKFLGQAVQADGRYAAAVQPVALPLSSLEAAVPSNFNLVSLEGATVGPLAFYGQGAGSLPTGNAMVQDVLDFKAGRRPHYDFSADLHWDPSLIESDYLLRTKASVPNTAGSFAEGVYLIKNMSCEEAYKLYIQVATADPSSFMIALPQED